MASDDPEECEACRSGATMANVKKILVISAQPPSQYGGGEIRLRSLLKHLAGDYEFTVIAPLRSDDMARAANAGEFCRFVPVELDETMPQRSRLYWRVNALRRAFFSREPRMATAFSSATFRGALSELLLNESFDLVQVQQLHMAQYALDRRSCPRVLDVDNLWSKLVPRLSELPSPTSTSGRIIDRLDEYKARRYEGRAVRSFEACLAVSKEDEGIIRRLAPSTLTAVLPNGVDTAYFSAGATEEEQEGSILFTGTMSWASNVDAVRFFAQHVLPMIRKHAPVVTFQVVGRDPGPRVRALEAEPGVTVTGAVEDVRPYFSQSQVYVVPLRAGAGSRLKILEAMAMGKPIVSTSLGAEGLDVTDGEDILIADQPEDFAEQTRRLLDDDELRATLGRNGRRLVESCYDWSRIAPKLGQVYETLASQGEF